MGSLSVTEEENGRKLLSLILDDNKTFNQLYSFRNVVKVPKVVVCYSGHYLSLSIGAGNLHI